MTDRRPRIWLLREALGEEDPYEVSFTRAGFDATSRPVLSFDPLNDEALRNALGTPDDYGGLILTSPRAADRFLEHVPSAASSAWRDLPIYVVGVRTGSDMRAAGFEVTGEDTGSGIVLASHIEDAYRGRKPLLFLAGDRRRPELVGHLSEQSMPFREITVYRTTQLTLDCPEVMPEWLAFFSPSGVSSVTHWPDLRTIRLAAIGSTTADELRKAGLRPAAVADAPTPDHLCRAVRVASGWLH